MNHAGMKIPMINEENFWSDIDGNLYLLGYSLND